VPPLSPVVTPLVFSKDDRGGCVGVCSKTEKCYLVPKCPNSKDAKPYEGIGYLHYLKIGATILTQIEMFYRRLASWRITWYC